MKDINFNKYTLNADDLVVEKRAYQENSTPEEIALLEERVKLLEEGIIYYHEVPVQCPFSVNVLFDKVQRLAENINSRQCGLIIDVSDADHPNAPTRKVINQRFARICNIIPHVAFITGKNAIMNTAIRFVLFGTNLKSYSVDNDVESALMSTKKKLQ